MLIMFLVIYLLPDCPVHQEKHLGMRMLERSLDNQWQWFYLAQLSAQA